MSRIEDLRKRASSPLLLVAAIAVLAVAAAACSSSSPTTTATGGSPTSPAPVATSPPASSPPATGGSDSGLSGAWSGTYSGVFSGTFKLVWHENGSDLHGVIHLNPGGTEPIAGAVNGSSIQFGTVGGSQAVTYTGSVSGNSMSGTYKIKTPEGSKNGSWSAHKTS